MVFFRLCLPNIWGGSKFLLSNGLKGGEKQGFLYEKIVPCFVLNDRTPYLYLWSNLSVGSHEITNR